MSYNNWIRSRVVGAGRFAMHHHTIGRLDNMGIEAEVQAAWHARRTFGSTIRVAGGGAMMHKLLTQHSTKVQPTTLQRRRRQENVSLVIAV